MLCPGLLEHALVRDSTSELSAAALEAVLEAAADAPVDFAAHYRTRIAWLQGFLGHIDGTGSLSTCTGSMFPQLLEPQYL